MNNDTKKGESPSFLTREKKSKNNTFGRRTKKEKKYCKKNGKIQNEER